MRVNEADWPTEGGASACGEGGAVSCVSLS